jgi:hypothetical protein
MLEIIASDDVMLMMSDEAYFHLDGYVNKKTVDFGLQRTRESYTRDLSILLRFQFGAAFRKWGSLVLTFFEEGATVTVTSERYVEMLRNFLHPQLRSLRVNMEEMWFQQDEATAHTARALMTAVRQMSPQHVVSLFGDVPWPPRSPDLSACNFFLWSYLKSKVYVRKPRTVDNLKVSFRKETATVPQEILVNVMQNFEERLRTCVQQVHHLSNIIFRK